MQEDINEILAEQQRELERIRAQRDKSFLNIDKEKLRKILNITFIVIAIIGVARYFMMPEDHLYSLVIIGVALFIKIIEFFIRFMF